MKRTLLLSLLVFLLILGGCAKTASFDTPSEEWSDPLIVTSQNSDAVEMLFDDGLLKFRINGKESYVYSIFDGAEQKNVAIETTMFNNGSQINNASILCRVNKDNSAWYEFHVASEGTYGLLRYDKSLKDAGKIPWVTLVKSGSSKAISNVKPNVIKAVCDGTKLTLTVNDTLLFEKENGDITEAGQVGLGAIAYDALPVVIGFDDFKISTP